MHSLRAFLPACLLLTALLCGVASAAAQDEPAAPPPATKPAVAPPSGTVDSTYELGPGDKVQINVFKQEELSGEYTLDGDGRFSMPLIGTVDANGLTPLELETLLVSRFKPDYLVNPRIFIQVGNYRPYYLSVLRALCVRHSDLMGNGSSRQGR